MTSNAISMVGNQLALLALPWFVLQTTGSPALVGIAGATEAIGIILSAFFGGALVDRAGFRRSSIFTDVVSGIAITLIPLLDRTVGLAFWQILFLIFCATIFNTPGTTARSSILRDLADLAQLRLERATSSDQVIRNVAGLGGPLLAGVLIAAISARNVLWIDATTFGLSALIFAAFIPVTGAHTIEAGERYLTGLRNGIRFIHSDRVILALAFIAAYANAIGGALFAVVLPVYAERTFGSAVGFGVLVAAEGGGALLGTILFGLVGYRLGRRLTLIIAFLVSFIALAVLVVTPALTISALALLVDGMAVGVIGTLVATTYQERIPANLRGRVFGTLGALHRLASPVGVILAGYLIQLFSLTSALATVALSSALMPILVAITPAFRSFERPADAEIAPFEDHPGPK
ncbi:MAG TPA: MFS transporter [Nitrolancea sp.]|nr:MFS transporter [Nitrolancea sp.]